MAFFRCVDYGLSGDLASEVSDPVGVKWLAISVEAQEVFRAEIRGLCYGDPAIALRWGGDAGARKLVENLDLFIGTEALATLNHFPFGSYTVVLDGECNYTPENACWVEDHAKEKAKSHWLELVVEEHEKLIATSEGREMLEQQREAAAKAQLRFFMAMGDIEDTRKAVEVLTEEKDQRVLDLGGWESVISLTAKLWHKLEGVLEERDIRPEDVAYLGIPRAGLLVLGLLSYVAGLTKYQVGPLLGVRRGRLARFATTGGQEETELLVGLCLYYNNASPFQAIVLIDDVAGMGHTLKRATKAVTSSLASSMRELHIGIKDLDALSNWRMNSGACDDEWSRSREVVACKRVMRDHSSERACQVKSKFPGFPVITAVLVDVPRLRLKDGVSPDVWGLQTDVANVQFPWGAPDFSHKLAREPGWVLDAPNEEKDGVES